MIYTAYKLPKPKPEPPGLHFNWTNPTFWARVQRAVEELDRENAAWRLRHAAKKQEAEVTG